MMVLRTAQMMSVRLMTLLLTPSLVRVSSTEIQATHSPAHEKPVVVGSVCFVVVFTQDTAEPEQRKE